MGMSRKRALVRMTSLKFWIELHLKKLADEPGATDVNHWREELRNWIAIVEDCLPAVGVRTGKIWSARLEDWKSQQGDDS